VTPGRDGLRSLHAAASFVDRVGLALVFPGAALILPSLWEATTGSREVDVFRHDERGRRVLTPELEHVWSLHTGLSEERLACVGKHIDGRLAVISLELLRARYALTGRSGRPSDFREEAAGTLEGQLAEAVLELGPQTSPELRRLVGADAKSVKRALTALERRLVLTHAGEAAEGHGWAAAIFDLTARRYEDVLGKLPARPEAEAQLAAVVLRGADEVSAADLAAVLGLRRLAAAAILDQLAEEGLAVRREGEGYRVWSVPRTQRTGSRRGLGR
jgi:biotin operon repressor